MKEFISNETENILTVLTKKTGKTEKEIIEIAIKMFAEKEEIIQKRIKEIELLGDDALLNIDEIIKNK